MTDKTGSLVHRRTIFDDWRSISIGLYMALAGYGVMVGLPVISTAWVTQLGFTEVEVGRVAGADLGGLAIGAVLAALFVANINRRYLILIAIAVAIGANAMCMVNTDYESTLWLRLIAGIGSGAYTSVAIATLGGSSKPAKVFNLMLFLFAFTQGAELFFLPMLSMNGIYWVFIATYLIGIPFLGWVPAYPVGKALAVDPSDSDDQPDDQPKKVPAYVPWMVLAAIVFTYINIGAYWTYIELASANSAADSDWVAKLLVFTSVASLFGCLVATLISNRFGLARPLMITLVFQAIIVAMLANGINNVNIMISMFSFNFCWIFVDVYQMATVANVDHSGRFAALLPGAQGLGQILGPNLAASVLAAGLGYGGVFILCGMASIIAMLIYLTMYLRLRKTLPALADAS